MYKGWAGVPILSETSPLPKAHKRKNIPEAQLSAYVQDHRPLYFVSSKTHAHTVRT